MSDVVSRLLAAIDEREKAAQAAAHEAASGNWRHSGDAEDVYTEETGSVVLVGPWSCGLFAAGTHAALNDPDAVLRLCQAHRDIVAEWQKRKQMTDQLAAEGYAGAAETGAAVVAGLWAAVTLLVRGYGVEDGED